MTKADKQYDSVVDVANDLKKSVDLLHIQYLMLDRLVEYAADKAKDKKLECELDDMVSLNDVVIGRINKQADHLTDKAVVKLQHHWSK